MQSLWLPAIYGQSALDNKKPASALNTLPVRPSIEFGSIQFVNNVSCLYPVYVRGQAYLAAGQGTAAVAEFQKIIDHSGIGLELLDRSPGASGRGSVPMPCSRQLRRERMPMPWLVSGRGCRGLHLSNRVRKSL